MQCGNCLDILNKSLLHSKYVKKGTHNRHWPAQDLINPL